MLYRHLHRDGRTKEEIPLVRGDAKIPEDGALLFSKNGKPRGWRAAVKLFSNRSPFTAPPMLEKYCSNRANNNGADGFKPRSAPPPPRWKIAPPWILDGCSEFRDGAVNNSLFINSFHSYLCLRRMANRGNKSP